MQFEGMRDIYNLYSIPNLNKINIGLFRRPKFCEIRSKYWFFKIIQYLDFDCGLFTFENMYNESYYFFLHSNYFAYLCMYLRFLSYCCLLYVVVIYRVRHPKMIICFPMGLAEWTRIVLGMRFILMNKLLKPEALHKIRGGVGKIVILLFV